MIGRLIGWSDEYGGDDDLRVLCHDGATWLINFRCDVQIFVFDVSPYKFV